MAIYKKSFEIVNNIGVVKVDGIDLYLPNILNTCVEYLIVMS